MNIVTVDRTLSEWDEACATNDRDRWVEHLDRIPVCDFFPVLAEREALTKGGKLLTLSQWLNYMGSRRHGDVAAEAEADSTVPETRLAAATYLRWIDRVETLLKKSSLASLPAVGVVQYFVDHLAASVLIGYKRIGSTVQLDQVLAVPNPEAYLDPVRALRFAKTPAQLELLRRSLYTRHKVVIQRNTLLHIDRERAADVFGPTIDTLLLNDWLHANRYARQRTAQTNVFFEDPIPRDATIASLEDGRTFLEIGCGNGLLTASFVRNEAMVKAFAAIDLSPNAVSATYENVVTQRHFHGSGIASRGRFTIGWYSAGAVPPASDLVVCNPPYVPELPTQLKRAGAHPLTAATVGTTLLQQVLRDSPTLVSPAGELLMISSTLAEPEIMAAVPSQMVIERLASRSVPFDLEPVRSEGQNDHVDWLTAERGLQAHDGALFHNIAIYRVSHPANRESETE